MPWQYYNVTRSSIALACGNVVYQWYCKSGILGMVLCSCVMWWCHAMVLSLLCTRISPKSPPQQTTFDKLPKLLRETRRRWAPLPDFYDVDVWNRADYVTCRNFEVGRARVLKTMFIEKQQSCKRPLETNCAPLVGMPPPPTHTHPPTHP